MVYVQYLHFLKFSHFSTCQLKTTSYKLTSSEWRVCPTTPERPPTFLLLCNRVRSYKLIIVYNVYYDYYKIDRNKQSKITVQETDTEHFYRQSRLTAVEQITLKSSISHFTQTNMDHSRLMKIPFPTLCKKFFLL
jgi:hypothetical protein